MSEAGSDETRVKVEKRGSAQVLTFSGRLDAAGVGPIWAETLRAAKTAKGSALVLDLSQVNATDTSGIALLLAAEAASGGNAEIVGINSAASTLLEQIRKSGQGAAPAGHDASGTDLVLAVYGAVVNGVAFLGEAAIATIRLPARRRMLRIGDLLRFADQAGVRALPLVLLLGFLIGLILAFQSIIPMRKFGADLYVANLVSISLLRELGPLLAAVVLSGRTGSAFAAEIGTMKVNEEVDALVAMGLDPMTMLVLPRMAVAMAVMPGLTLAMDVAGLLGMTIVMIGFGFPYEAIAAQVQYAAVPRDLYGGLVKSVVFGAAVAAIGCAAGLGTGAGPRAVGLSATAAVVGGIVSAIVLDGAFAVLFYRMGL